MSELNLQEIKNQVSQVISYSQEIQNPKVDDLIDSWLEAKRDFIEAMNGELIYCYPQEISFSLDPVDRNRLLDNFIEDVFNRYRNDDLIEFLDLVRDNFFENRLIKDINFRTKMGKNIFIPKGMKIVKAFKYFEEDKCALTDLQNYASRLIQEDKIKGYFCISVHPLDFLSLSENNHNWRSCHALDGEYRAGNLNYMVDSSTVICYLRSSKDSVLPNFPFPWNDKKWRVLLYFSNDWNMLFAGKPYPFNSSDGLNFILTTMLDKSGLAKDSTWTKWDDTKINFIGSPNNNSGYSLKYKYYPVGETLKPLHELVKNGEGALQFNDVLQSSTYQGLYSFRLRYSPYFAPSTGYSTSETCFSIGKEVKCLRCGEKPIKISSSFQCVDCECEYGSCEDDDDFGYCECCGARVYLGDDTDVYYVDGSIVCSHCAELETIVCQNCGERFFKNEIIFDREHESYLCEDCYDSIVREAPQRHRNSFRALFDEF